ncbi:MAG: cell division protein FtsZ, partial [Chitinophagaceae bacterium]
KCITDVINSTGQINVDFADVCTVMKNGGVAILGNASCSGEDRAQRAIEEALNSPLLNDNDIRGAKWILININSAEGENEFTMDEVEIIQTHLLSQAGEHTDVILGLGYDNTLGDEIGITLIATGFEHKDPFVKKLAIKQQPQEEKIVMTLGDEQQPQRPVPAEPTIEDTLAPTLVDEDSYVAAPQMQVEEEPKEEGPIQYFELGGQEKPAPKEEEAPTVGLQMKFKEEKAEQPEMDWEKKELERQKKALEDKFEALRQNILGQNMTGNTPAQPPAAGGYLSRPSNIYAENKQQAAKPEEPLRNQQTKMEQDEAGDMQLVIRNENSIADAPATQASQTPQADDTQNGNAVVDKQRATERLQKLRNLSFNLNAADPNNEFENVPAYIRRNMELYQGSSSVENFYSNYTVKSDGKNNATISTINTFLDGKKPD